MYYSNTSKHTCFDISRGYNRVELELRAAAVIDDTIRRLGDTFDKQKLNQQMQRVR